MFNPRQDRIDCTGIAASIHKLYRAQSGKHGERRLQPVRRTLLISKHAD